MTSFDHFSKAIIFFFSFKAAYFKSRLNRLKVSIFSAQFIVVNKCASLYGLNELWWHLTNVSNYCIDKFCLKMGHRVDNELLDLRCQQLEAENERRVRRNREVDHLIANISDPRVAQRLRIYQLVEEKFLAVEKQVSILFFWVNSYKLKLHTF